LQIDVACHGTSENVDFEATFLPGSAVVELAGLKVYPVGSLALGRYWSDISGKATMDAPEVPCKLKLTPDKLLIPAAGMATQRFPGNAGKPLGQEDQE
jgi:hypothetical protein